jgi:hypothetical protein
MKMFTDKCVLLVKISSRNSKMAGIGQAAVQLDIGMEKTEFSGCYKGNITVLP